MLENHEETPFVAEIKRLYEDCMKRECHFHLASCGACGGPSFQQPCSLCGYYPMGQRDGAEQRAHTRKMTCEGFAAAVRRSGVDGAEGNVATWYAASLRKSSAYRDHSSFKREADEMARRAQEMSGLPGPEEIWDRVVVAGKTMWTPPTARETPPRAPDDDAGFRM